MRSLWTTDKSVSKNNLIFKSVFFAVILFYMQNKVIKFIIAHAVLLSIFKMTRGNNGDE